MPTSITYFLLQTKHFKFGEKRQKHGLNLVENGRKYSLNLVENSKTLIFICLYNFIFYLC